MANLINLLIRILIMQKATKTADDDTDTGDSGVKPQAAEVVEEPVVLSKTKIAAISLTITSAVLMTNTENKEGYREKPYPDTIKKASIFRLATIILNINMQAVRTALFARMAVMAYGHAKSGGLRIA